MRPFGRLTADWRPTTDIGPPAASSVSRIPSMLTVGGKAVWMKYSAIRSSSRPARRMPQAESTARPARPTCW